jgi:hypothetical protein
MRQQEGHPLHSLPQKQVSCLSSLCTPCGKPQLIQTAALTAEADQALRSGAVLHGSVGGRTEPISRLCSGGADGLRPSKLKHAVQGMNGDGDLRQATLVRSRAQRISNHSFEATDGSLHQSPTRVPGRLLPADASMLCDALEMPITLGRCAPLPCRSVPPLSVAGRSLSHQDGACQRYRRRQLDHRLHRQSRKRVNR